MKKNFFINRWLCFFKRINFISKFFSYRESLINFGEFRNCLLGVKLFKTNNSRSNKIYNKINNFFDKYDNSFSNDIVTENNTFDFLFLKGMYRYRYLLGKEAWGKPDDKLVRFIDLNEVCSYLGQRRHFKELQSKLMIYRYYYKGKKNVSNNVSYILAFHNNSTHYNNYIEFRKCSNISLINSPLTFKRCNINFEDLEESDKKFVEYLLTYL